MTAIVLAAGAGTRMKSARAKVLHEIAGKPLIAHALLAVRGVGCATTVTVVGHEREQVSAAIADLDLGVIEAIQDEPRGTGHAVQIALEAWASSRRAGWRRHRARHVRRRAAAHQRNLG